MSQITGSTATIVREQVKRIHCAVNDGTLDRDTVNDALAKISELVDAKDEKKPDSFMSFTNQGPAPAQPAPAGFQPPKVGSPDLNTQPPPFTPPQDG